MFRLPSESNNCKYFTSFSSFVDQERKNGPKPPSPIHCRRPYSSNGTYHKKQSKLSSFLEEQKESRSHSNKKSRPKSVTRQKETFQKDSLSKYNITNEILISPSNKKFKYCVNTPDNNQFESNIMRTNFLLEPCKVTAMPILPKEFTKDFRLMPIEKYSSPYRDRPFIQAKTERLSRSLKKAKLQSKNIKGRRNKQEHIEPWEIKDYHYQSIRLNIKNTQ